MEIVSEARAFDGTQGVYRHEADTTRCPMIFAVYLPPQAEAGPVPVLWYLSGLTCTHANVMDKGEYRRAAARHGLAFVAPDTSPRGPDVPDDPNDWRFGCGAGFYLDAMQAPYDRHYRMWSYVADELPALVAAKFPVDLSRQGVLGHSMGGHGALTLALTYPERYRSCSAFAPIVQPSTAGWSAPAFERYLGPDRAAWRAHDATSLIEDGRRFPEFLVDQGTADPFLDDGLRPHLLDEACRRAGIGLTLHMREGYDHSYNFISTYMDDHVAWAAERLQR